MLVRNRIYRIIHWRRLCHDHSWLSKQVYTFKQATSKDLRLHFIHQFLKQQLIEEKKNVTEENEGLISRNPCCSESQRSPQMSTTVLRRKREKKRKKLFRTAICSDSVP